MIPAYPKIHSLGQRHNAALLASHVEITEKIDGSQFSFGKCNGEFFIRSKGQMIDPCGEVQQLFNLGVKFALSVKDKIPDNSLFHGETLCRPRHNKLAYDRVPKNNFMLFAVRDLHRNEAASWHAVETWANDLGCEVVPLLFSGIVENKDQLEEIIDATSVLGGVKMEGVVVKSHQKVKVGDEVLPFMQGKFVSDAFKEVMGVKITGKDRVQELFENYQTVPRWEKAVQHVRERGELEGSPRDIGKLMAEINNDVEGECGEEVKELLWQMFRKDFLKTASSGFPQWYKNLLTQQAFEEVA